MSYVPYIGAMPRYVLTGGWAGAEHFILSVPITPALGAAGV